MTQSLRKVGLAKAVEEVLAEDPTAVGVSSFLRCMVGLGRKEGIVGETVDERGLANDLYDSGKRTDGPKSAYTQKYTVEQEVPTSAR